MSKPQQLQLQRMCGKPDTVEKALSLLITASARTGPGSGHDIGQGASGLAAICAFLASQQLGNDDVSEKTAQAASCLAPKIFKPTLATVRNVIEQAAVAAHLNDTPQRRQTRTQTNVTYPTLLTAHKVLLEDVVAGWLEDTERILDSLPEFRASYDSESSTVKCTVFFWVCQIIGLSRINRKLMTERYDINTKASDELVTILNTHAGDLKDTIATQVEQMKKKKTPGRKTKSSIAIVPHIPTAITVAHSQVNVTETAPDSSNDQESAAPATRELLLSPRKSAMKQSIPTDNPATPRRAVKFISTSQSLPQLESRSSRPSSPSKKRRTLPSDTAEDDQTIPTEPETPRRLSRNTAHDDEPMTPVRSARRGSGSVSPSKRQRKARSPSSDATAHDSDGQEEEFLPLPRHYRPMFADRQQWLARDPRAERDLAAARRAAVKAENLWGHPFSYLRGPETMDMRI